MTRDKRLCCLKLDTHPVNVQYLTNSAARSALVKKFVYFYAEFRAMWLAMKKLLTDYADCDAVFCAVVVANESIK